LAQGEEHQVDKDFINAEITGAMRAQDKVRLSILRLVKNEIDTKEKETGERLPDEEVTATFKKVLKQTGETLEGSVKAGTDEDRTARLREQVAILEGYLPATVSGDALQALVDKVVSENGFAERRDMGKAIGIVVSETGGNVDKAEVARLVGQKLK
jgi:uncharacterized protein